MNFVLEDFLFVLLNLALSFVAGAILGLERKFRQQVVGMRTLILISESCTLLSMLSIHISTLGLGNGGDPTRIVSTVCSGIGFLGAGAILRQGLNIKGLTSAAIIWTAAAIGLAIGAGFYIPAFIVLAISIFSLVRLEHIESRFFPAGKLHMVTIVYESKFVDLKLVSEIVSKMGMIVTDIGLKKTQSEITIQVGVKAPQDPDLFALEKDLETLAPLKEFVYSE